MTVRCQIATTAKTTALAATKRIGRMLSFLHNDRMAARKPMLGVDKTLRP
jgi:hypothetical protein